MNEEILQAGFVPVDASDDVALPPEICKECARKALAHECGLVAVWCDHIALGAVRVVPGKWKLHAAPDAAHFFAAVLLTPGMAANQQPRH